MIPGPRLHLDVGFQAGDVVLRQAGDEFLKRDFSRLAPNHEFGNHRVVVHLEKKNDCVTGLGFFSSGGRGLKPPSSYTASQGHRKI
jgi:hypothetical protein